MDARRPADQQLGGALHAPGLHLLGAEGRDADLGHPDRLVGRPPGSRRSSPAIRGSATGSSRAGSRAPRRRRPASSTPCSLDAAGRSAGSIGDMPPSTRGQRRVLRRGSRWPAQRRHLGEAAPSRGRAPGPSATCCWARSRSSPLRSSRASPRVGARIDGAGAIGVGLGARGRGRPRPRDGRRSRSRRAQHRLGAGAVGHPPVGRVVGVAMLDEVQLRVAGLRRRCSVLAERRSPRRPAPTSALPRCIDWNTSRSPATCSRIRSSASSGWRRW